MPAAPPLARRAFNDRPYHGGFGLTSAGTYTFSGNVASVSRLGLFSSGLQPTLVSRNPTVSTVGH